MVVSGTLGLMMDPETTSRCFVGVEPSHPGLWTYEQASQLSEISAMAFEYIANENGLKCAGARRATFQPSSFMHG